MQKKVTNLHVLSELTDNNQALIKKYVLIFLNNSPPAIHDLQQKIKEKDWVSVKQLAHGFKSQLSYMGMENERKILEQIEKICVNGHDIHKITTLFDTMLTSLEIAYSELNDFISRTNNLQKPS